jgi:nucleotide-binding universal stress UspA family protein
MVPPTGWYVDPNLIDHLWADADEQAQQAAVAARNMMDQAGLIETAAVLRGDPRALLVNYAKDWNADLMVVGSHGRRGLTRMLLGSVSEAVAFHAHCSVDLIRQSSQRVEARVKPQ